MEEFDDGNGYVPLRDLMRIVHDHLERSGYHFTDGELVGVYRQTLGGSLFAIAGGRLASASIWNAFEDEFADLRRGQRTERVEESVAGEVSLLRTSFVRRCCDLLARLRFANVGPARWFRQLLSQLGWRSEDLADNRDRAGDDGDSTGKPAHMINLTVVDLGGKQLMVDAVASTWSVQTLQQHIERDVGVSAHRQLLFCTGTDGFEHELCPDDACLSTAGVAHDSTLLLVVKDEVKLDYKRFVSRFMNVDLEQAAVRA